MDITENKLQQIIIEELREQLGLDQEYDAIKAVRTVLEEYTGDDIESAMEVLDLVKAALFQEMEEEGIS